MRMYLIVHTCNENAVVLSMLETLRNKTAGRFRTAECRAKKCSRKTGNAQSRTAFFRHSAGPSFPAVLLRKVAITTTSHSLISAIGLSCTRTFTAKHWRCHTRTKSL